MVDYLALVGDSSDNIPGVKGVGEKTALPLIQEFGSIENIYKNIEKVDKPGTKKKLEESKDNAFLSKELATINCSVPMEFNFDEAKFSNPDFDKLRDLFIELEFKNLYTRLLKVYDGGNEQKQITNEELFTANTFDKSKSKYELITTKKDAEKLFEKLNKKDLIVFDTETDSLDPFELNILGASFSTKAGEAYFIAIDPGSKIFSDGKKRLPVDDFKKIFKPLFENKKIKKVCQNGKYDISVMRGLGIKVENFYFDTMVASYIIDPDQKHGMDDLSQKYLSYQPIPLSSLIGEKKDPTKMYDVEVEKLSDYAAEDADITFQLYEILSKEVKKEKLEKVAYDVDFPLVPVLEAMEYEGVKIDKSALESFSKDLQKLITDLHKKNI